MWGQFENLQSFFKMAATPPSPTPSQVINDQPFSIVYFNPATLTGIKSLSTIPLWLQDGVILGSPKFSSSVELVCSQLVCLQPDGIITCNFNHNIFLAFLFVEHQYYCVT